YRPTLAPCTPLLPYTTLFRSRTFSNRHRGGTLQPQHPLSTFAPIGRLGRNTTSQKRASPWRLRGGSHEHRATSVHDAPAVTTTRSEEHTSELQSRFDLVCRLL